MYSKHCKECQKFKPTNWRAKIKSNQASSSNSTFCFYCNETIRNNPYDPLTNHDRSELHVACYREYYASEIIGETILNEEGFGDEEYVHVVELNTDEAVSSVMKQNEVDTSSLPTKEEIEYFKEHISLEVENPDVNGVKSIRADGKGTVEVTSTSGQVFYGKLIHHGAVNKKTYDQLKAAGEIKQLGSEIVEIKKVENIIATQGNSKQSNSKQGNSKHNGAIKKGSNQKGMKTNDIVTSNSKTQNTKPVKTKNSEPQSTKSLNDSEVPLNKNDSIEAQQPQKSKKKKKKKSKTQEEIEEEELAKAREEELKKYSERLKNNDCRFVPVDMSVPHSSSVEKINEMTKILDGIDLMNVKPETKKAFEVPKPVVEAPVRKTCTEINQELDRNFKEKCGRKKRNGKKKRKH